MIGQIKRFIKSNAWLFQGMKQCLLYFRYLKSIRRKSRYASLPQYRVKDTIVIGNKGHHCYFGYYDKSPLNENSRYALFMKIAKDTREGDMAEVCIYDMQTKEQRTVGQTRTWNWQQGAMEQWVDANTVSYNSYDEERNVYQTIRVNVDNSEKSITDRAAYFYNKSFSKYLSLNFYRLDKFAKGYGYPFSVDTMNYDEDGIWEVEIVTNKAALVLSLAEVMAFEQKDYMQCQHYINHVAYCPDERFIIFIHRWQVKGGEFVSRLLKYDLQEKKLVSLLDNGHVSHYCWKSDKELMIFATNERNEKGYMVVDIETGDNYLLEGLPTEDGHPTYSDDKKWVVTDTYPDNHRDQYLFLYSTDEKKLCSVDRLHSPLKYFNENRCDLHPRWSKDNRYLLVDNTAKGVRTLKIYEI